MKNSLNNSRRWFLAPAAAVATLLMGAASPALAGFNFTDFSSTAGLTLAGSAIVTGNTIAVTPSTDHASGGAWYTAAKQSVASGFVTDFQIRVFDRKGLGADGYAFVIQNSAPAPVGGAGGGIGFATNSVYGQPGISNSLAVEFDVWNNSSAAWPDYPGLPKHVSIQSNGLNPNSPSQDASLGAAAMGDLNDGQIHNIRVAYVAGVMSVYIDDMSNAVLSRFVDLSSIISLDGGKAWVGITSATGLAENQEGHELRSWSFTGNDLPTPSAATILGLGGIAAARRRRTA